MSSTAKIAVEVKANAKGIGPPLSAAERRLSRFQSKANAIARGSGGGFLSLAGSIKNTALAATGLGGALSLAGAAVGIKNTITRLDELGDKAKGLKESASNLAELDYIATRVGSSGEAAALGMDKVVKSIGDAATKGGAGAEVFAALGLDLEYLQTLSPAQAFIAAAGAIAELPNVYEKASAAQAIFGKGAKDIMAFFDDPGEIAEYSEDFAFLAGDTDKAAEAAGKAQDQFDRAGLALSGVMNQAVIDLAPDIVGITKSVVDAAVEFRKWNEDTNAISGSMGVLKDMVEAVTPVVDVLAGSLKMVSGGGVALANAFGLAGGVSQTGTGAVNQKKLSKYLLRGDEDIQRRVADANTGGTSAGLEMMKQAVEDSSDSMASIMFPGQSKNGNNGGALAGPLFTGAATGGATGPSLSEAYRAAEAQADLAESAADILREIETPAEKLQKELDRIAEVYESGAITEEQNRRAIESAQGDYQKAIERAANDMGGGSSGGTTGTTSYGGGGDMGGGGGMSDAFWDYNLPRGGFVGGSIPANYRVFDDPAAAWANGGRRSGHLTDFMGSNAGGGDDGMAEQTSVLRSIDRNSRNVGIYA